MKRLDTVPNQRTLTINKEIADKEHRYTVNNLEALGEASRRLQSKGGFKLYMYLAKHQNKHRLALSSNDFCLWSGLGITAYRTAFEELIEEGYLVKRKGNDYVFYDKSRKEDNAIEEVVIDIPKEKVIEVNEFMEMWNK